MCADDLWKRVCRTVNPLGGPRSSRSRPLRPYQEATEIDLHGMTVDEAHRAAMSFLTLTGQRSVLIITGRSGVITREFPFWIQHIPMVSRYDSLNDGGAYRVYLKPRPTRS